MTIKQFANTWKPRILILVLTGAFVLSFVALWETAQDAGYTSGWALLWPLMLDGVVLYCVISLAERQSEGLAVGWTWGIMIAFDIASILLNAAYGFEIGWQASIIHALPAAVAPLMMKLYTADVKDAETAKKAAIEAKQAERRQSRKAQPKAAGEAKNAAFGPQNLPAANVAKADKIELRRAMVRDLWQQGLTRSMISEQLSAAGHASSSDTISRDLKAMDLSDDGPDVAPIVGGLLRELNQAVPTNGKANGHAS